MSFPLFCWIEFIAFFQLEASSWEFSFVPLLNEENHCFPSIRTLFVREHLLLSHFLNWVQCILSAFLLFVLLNWNYLFFLQLEAFSCLSIPFLPTLLNWLRCFPSAWRYFCLRSFLSSILLNWVHCFLSARSLFVREHFLCFVLLNWVLCILSALLSSVLLNWNYYFLSARSLFVPAFPFFHPIELHHCFLSDWNILFEIISFFPSCWIEFIAFYSARSLFVREHFVCLILLNWIHCILSAFLLSVLLNRNHDFLSATSLFVPASPFFHPTELTSLLSFSLKYFRLTSFLFFQASGWKKAMRSIQQNGRKQMLTEEHAFS